MTTSYQMRRDIDKYVRKWRKILGLTGWRLRVVVRETTPPEDKDPAKGSCVAWPEYKEAILTFTLDLMRQDGADTEELVAHELTHCLTWPLTAIADTYAGDDKGLREWAREATERVTTDVTDTLYSLVKQLKS